MIEARIGPLDVHAAGEGCLATAAPCAELGDLSSDDPLSVLFRQVA